MSLIYHPDKIRPDPAKNETMETLNERFVELTKAYKALTDEEIRNNYLQYGHPDGKQSFSIGIALPKIIITEGSGKYVLLVYGGLLGVLLPYIVGKWWYGSQRYTREKVLLASAGNIFREYKEDMIGGRVVSALSTGEEFKDLLKGPRSEEGLAKVEKKVLAIDEKILTLNDREILRKLDDSTRRKALSLLWAYLNRIDLEDTTLDEGKPCSPNNESYRDDLANTIIMYREIRSGRRCLGFERIFYFYFACVRQSPTCYWRLSNVPESYSSYSSWLVPSSPITTLQL